MRKYLLSTSALAGAALISSVAIADVSISGSVEFQYSDSDSNIAANDGTIMGSTNEVTIDFTNKTDSGLTISYGMDLDGHVGGDVNDNQLTIEGGFGKLVLGQTDGASDGYSINAQGLIAEETDGTTTSATILKDSSGAGITGNDEKITYHLPAMGGLTAAISYQDSSVAGSDDMTELGFNYAMDAGGAAITIGYTQATKENATQDLDATNIGAKIVTNGITFTASQATYEASGEDITGQGFGASYTLPSGLTIAAATFKSEDDSTADLGEEYTVNHYEASYPIASGLTAVVTVSDFDYENGAESNGAADENGTITTLNLKASF